jgi:copper chaperone NosL
MKAHPKHRILVALAALVLLPVFVVPVWTIQLVAPQYSDGLGMYIGVSQVWGHDTHDIQNINILNHYIGMKEIRPDSIPELDLFPPILAAIIATGLIAALIGRRWVMASWLVVFIGLGIAGMVDFYLWMLDYGHNLSPDAPIKIPGMTYTPPLIGTKQLLNMTASSWPHIGTGLIGLSIALAGVGVLGSYGWPGLEKARGLWTRLFGRTPAAAAVVLAVSLALAGCASEKAPQVSQAQAPATAERIVYGESEDPYCGKLVERVRWGGEIRTKAGERLRFRSVECLAAYLLEERTPPAEIAEVRVVDFPDGFALIDVEDTIFLHTPNLSSRTGLNLVSIRTEYMARNLQDAYAGSLIGWDEVLELVATEWGVGPNGASAAR